MTEEMSGGPRHHTDEHNGPSQCGWIEKQMLKKSIFLKTAKILGIENVQPTGESRL